MRVDGKNSKTCLHYHDGSTCHGKPTLEACAQDAVAKRWEGRILKKDDTYEDGTPVACYSLIASNFDHWRKHGTFVAEIEITPTVKLLP